MTVPVTVLPPGASRKPEPTAPFQVTVCPKRVSEHYESGHFRAAASRQVPEKRPHMPRWANFAQAPPPDDREHWPMRNVGRFLAAVYPEDCVRLAQACWREFGLEQTLMPPKYSRKRRMRPLVIETMEEQPLEQAMDMLAPKHTPTCGHGGAEPTR